MDSAQQRAGSTGARTRHPRRIDVVLTAVVAVGIGWLALTLPGDPVVEVARIPEGGRMPRAVIDAAGNVHAIYFEGVMSGGELLYISRAAGRERLDRAAAGQQ